jgi:2-polyprenyl-6-methoxyphenol hydroxylase-like FAD-dependent oxidoreductase
VVGADGRASRVRKTFGFGAESHRYERPIAVLFGRPAARNAANDLEVHLTPGQMVAVIPRTGGLCKIGIPIAASAAGAWRQASSTELKTRLKALVPHRDFDDLHFADVYPPIYLRADSWVRDNVVLIGDACHAMHPARSQGMNTSIRCIDALAIALRTCVGLDDLSVIGRTLADYESAHKSGIDAMLEVNHRHGLEMDASGEQAYQKACESLAAVQASPQVREAFASNAAGFSTGALS